MTFATHRRQCDENRAWSDYRHDLSSSRLEPTVFACFLAIRSRRAAQMNFERSEPPTALSIRATRGFGIHTPRKSFSSGRTAQRFIELDLIELNTWWQENLSRFFPRRV